MTAPVSLTQLPPILEQRGGDPELLAQELLHIIGDAICNDPRTLQTRIGPSGIGTPCDRKLMHRIAETPDAVKRPAPWKPTIGKAVHAWLENVFTQGNRDLHPARWLTEKRILTGRIGDTDINGSCDLYDRVTATSVDWKITTRNKIREQYRPHGPGPEYRVQAHAYGTGWQNRGLPVDIVAVMFIPRDGELADAHYWHEPYNPQITADAFTRANDINTLHQALGPAAFPLTPTADDYCTHCVWYVPGTTNLAKACPGDPSLQNRTDPVTALITS